MVLDLQRKSEAGLALRHLSVLCVQTAVESGEALKASFQAYLLRFP